MGPANIKNKLSFFSFKRGMSILAFIITALILVVVYVVYHRHQQQQFLSHSEEKRSAQFDQQSLNNHDYNGYQLQLSSYASTYIDKGMYGDAERVLNEIVTNVPQDKIISQTYRAYWYLYEKNGDTQNRKKYAKLTAEKLRQEGQDKAAVAFEQDANGK